ncbi:SRPBCC family protein [Ignatzschineria sp. LJL83]
MSFQESIHIASSKEAIFALYRDISNWNQWDDEVEASAITGSFSTGSSGFLKPLKGPKSKIYLADVKDNRSFTVTSNLPLCKITFEHEIIPIQDNLMNVIHRVSFSGILSPLFGKIIGKQIQKGLPKSLSGLKSSAEKLSHQ